MLQRQTARRTGGADLRCLRKTRRHGRGSGKPLADGEVLLAQKQKLEPGVIEFIQQSQDSAARKRRLRKLIFAAFVLLLLLGIAGSSFFAWQANENANQVKQTNTSLEKTNK